MFKACSVVLLAASLVASSSPMVSAASNDFEIQSVKNTNAFAEGQVFERGAKISIPEGASISLIDRTGPLTRSRTCAGKYDGPIEICTKAMISGGTRVVPGGTRGVAK